MNQHRPITTAQAVDDTTPMTQGSVDKLIHDSIAWGSFDEAQRFAHRLIGGARTAATTISCASRRGVLKAADIEIVRGLSRGAHTLAATLDAIVAASETEGAGR